jgi:hypothetical protein
MFDHTYIQLSLYDNLRWYCGWETDLTTANNYLWTFVGEFTGESDGARSPLSLCATVQLCSCSLRQAR